MSKNKGKPSGSEARSKSDIGRKADYKRSGWPEEAPTQHVQDAAADRRHHPRQPEAVAPGRGEGRDRKAGGPD